MDPVNWPQLMSAAVARVNALRGAEATLEAVKVAASLDREQTKAFARRDAALAEAISAERALADVKTKCATDLASIETRHKEQCAEYRKADADIAAEKVTMLADYAHIKKATAAQCDLETAEIRAAFEVTRSSLRQEIELLEGRRLAAQTALDALKRA